MLKEVLEALNEVYKSYGDIPIVVNLGDNDLISMKNLELACTEKDEYVLVVNPHDVDDWKAKKE